MEREAEQAAQYRREADRTMWENEELRRKVGRLEEEIREIKERLVEETDGETGGLEGVVGPPSARLSHPPCACPPCRGGGRGLPPLTGGVPRRPLP